MPDREGKSRIRDAASVLLVRHAPEGPQVLMGKRGEEAAFMPSKYVFPGGAVDAGDAVVPFAAPLGAACMARLALHAPPGIGPALAAAALRELWEETGLMLGAPGRWPGAAPPDWRGFADAGLLPDASALRFVFRAVTPPGRPRRFDARFFLADAGRVTGDADDFARACDELSHLHWVALAEARRLNLAFITEVVLAEVTHFLAANETTLPNPESVPFFDNAGAASQFRRL